MLKRRNREEKSKIKRYRETAKTQGKKNRQRLSKILSFSERANFFLPILAFFATKSMAFSLGNLNTQQNSRKLLFRKCPPINAKFTFFSRKQKYLEHFKRGHSLCGVCVVISYEKWSLSAYLCVLAVSYTYAHIVTLTVHLELWLPQQSAQTHIQRIGSQCLCVCVCGSETISRSFKYF